MEIGVFEGQIEGLPTLEDSDVWIDGYINHHVHLQRYKKQLNFWKILKLKSG